MQVLYKRSFVFSDSFVWVQTVDILFIEEAAIPILRNTSGRDLPKESRVQSGSSGSKTGQHSLPDGPGP